MLNTYYNPVRTIHGSGSLAELALLANEYCTKKKPLLVLWTKELLKNEVIKAFAKKFNAEILIFSASNPDIKALFNAYIEIKSMDIGVIIAIGGGSVLDVGKSLCCLLGESIKDEDALRDFIEEKKYSRPKCPWIGVPTTAGTGSEVTCWATVWDPEKGLKYSVDTAENYAAAAVVDPELLYTMPLNLAVSSALDAAAHATEAYWAKASNTVSRALALKAISLIMGKLDALLLNPKDKEAHSQISMGSMVAGMAFSGTRTTACHSISYPLTMEYGIPHGVAVAMLIAPVAKLNKDSIEDFENLLSAYGVKGIKELKKKIENLLKGSGNSYTLSQWGVKEGNLKALAKGSITKGRADNNPAKITKEVVLNILKDLM